MKDIFDAPMKLQYAAWETWPLQKETKEETMAKKLMVPKDYNEICQNCGKTYGAHNWFNCKDGGKWIPPAPVSDYPEYIAPKSLMNKPQQLDEALKVVETVLKALRQTNSDVSKVSAIAAVRFVTNITLVEANDIVNIWAKKNKWWDQKPASNYPKWMLGPTGCMPSISGTATEPSFYYDPTFNFKSTLSGVSNVLPMKKKKSLVF